MDDPKAMQSVDGSRDNAHAATRRPEEDRDGERPDPQRRRGSRPARMEAVLAIPEDAFSETARSLGAD